MLTEQREAEHLAGDQALLAPFERGVFEVTDRDLNEVPPYQNDAFIQQVKDIATFDHAKAAPPAPAGATVAASGRNVSWSEGEHPRLSKYTTSLVEHFPAWNVRAMSGLRALHGHHHRSLRWCSPEMHTVTHLK